MDDPKAYLTKMFGAETADRILGGYATLRMTKPDADLTTFTAGVMMGRFTVLGGAEHKRVLAVSVGITGNDKAGLNMESQA